MSNDTFKIVDNVIVGDYIHPILEANKKKRLTYAYASDDHFCSWNKCGDNTKINIESTLKLNQKKKQAFLGLETKSKNDEKIRNVWK